MAETNAVLMGMLNICRRKDFATNINLNPRGQYVAIIYPQHRGQLVYFLEFRRNAEQFLIRISTKIARVMRVRNCSRMRSLARHTAAAISWISAPIVLLASGLLMVYVFILIIMITMSISMYVNILLSGLLVVSLAVRTWQYVQMRRSMSPATKGYKLTSMIAIFFIWAIVLTMALGASPRSLAPEGTYVGREGVLQWSLTILYYVVDTVLVGTPGVLTDWGPPIEPAGNLGSRVIHLLKFLIATGGISLLYKTITPPKPQTLVGTPAEIGVTAASEDVWGTHRSSIHLVGEVKLSAAELHTLPALMFAAAIEECEAVPFANSREANMNFQKAIDSASFRELVKGRLSDGE